MTVIYIDDLKPESYLSELTEMEIDSTRGGLHPLVAFWIGYQIGKEIAEIIEG